MSVIQTTTKVIRPVDNWLVSSPYGTYRNFIVNGVRINGPHEGIDIKGRINTPMKSIADGKVLDTTVYSNGNKTITTVHGGVVPGYTLICRYAHCNSVLLKQNDIIKQGDVIAFMGTTGNSSGVHLHFECILIPSAMWYNPITKRYYSYNPNSLDSLWPYRINPEHLF